ncbi:hypothetical protein AXG93_2091s1230 [Marchantia polymorpha subsp. ruderalis]|uniref:Uncharacterized protein n=1 Tax=Marchantia polymorpha subsp. ruderalis TaxID=1480154 RepID=A0A176W8I0_MARPO|nr:hypothetical protein AXG93_2091s1230 [Marchantia polymorpha subsp. ruderalis]
MSLTAPPTRTFATSEEVIAYVKAFTHSESYKVKIGISAKFGNLKEGENTQQRMLIKKTIATNRARKLNQLSKSSIWEHASKKISHYDLNLALEQHQKSMSLPKDSHCTHILSVTKVIPCAHLFKEYSAVPNRQLQLQDFHQQWWLHQPVTRVPAPVISGSEGAPERSFG